MENELLGKITETVKGELKSYASKEDLHIALDKAVSDLQATNKGAELEKAIAELNEVAKAQGEAIAKMKQSEPAAAKTIKQQLESQSKALEALSKGDMMSKATILPAAITNNYNGYQIPGIGQIQTRNVVINDLFAQSGIAPNSQRTIRYMDQTARATGAAARSVGAAAAESAKTWQGYNLGIESVSHFIPVAKEMLTDFDFIESEINNDLLLGLALKLETDSLNGNGSTPTIKGLAASATNWTDPGVDFSAASILHLIMSCSTQIGYNTKYKSNYVLLNDFDALKLQLSTDGQGRLLFPNFISNDGMQIGNVKVIATPLVTANTMYVGDFNFGTMYKRPATIEIGYNATDFTERQVSILANVEVALLIKALNEAAFIYVADVATAIATITE